MDSAFLFLSRGVLSSAPLKQTTKHTFNMKRIPPETITADDGIIRNTGKEGFLLHIEKDIYAYRPCHFERITFAFESQLLTRYLMALRLPVGEVEIVHLVSESYSYKLGLPFEVRMHLSNGKIAVLDSEDRHYVLEPFPSDDEEPTAVPATDVWELPNRTPFSKMSLSSEAIDELAGSFGLFSPEHALNTLWDAFVVAAENDRHHSLHVELTVQSALGKFSAVEHLCGRVAFYLPDEVPMPYRLLF